MNPTQYPTVEPAPGAALTPQQIIDYNHAFADSLQMLQGPATQQRTQILALIVDILQQFVKLSGEAQTAHPATAAIENLKHHVDEALKAASDTPHREAVNIAAASHDWFQNLMRALSIAQDNAVMAQQQLNIIGNAALTEGLAALLSIVPSELGKGATKA